MKKSIFATEPELNKKDAAHVAVVGARLDEHLKPGARVYLYQGEDGDFHAKTPDKPLLSTGTLHWNHDQFYEKGQVAWVLVDADMITDVTHHWEFDEVPPGDFDDGCQGCFEAQAEANEEDYVCGESCN